MDLQFDHLSEKLIEFIYQYAPKLLGVVLVWVVGSWVIRLLVRLLKKILERGKSDLSLRSFLISLTSIG